ncbi:hypothetical protein HYX14_02310 [Candidatus Woesearchaeota archaeon]|nr:hypothetical protein [Candidatus Woesearchaeota archaeon]
MAKKEANEKCGQLNAKALAVALGGLWGAYVFILGIILTIFPNAKFFWVSKELLGMLATLYPGYAATFTGSIVGLLWGILCGAVGGLLITWLHNWALEKYCE